MNARKQKEENGIEKCIRKYIQMHSNMQFSVWLNGRVRFANVFNAIEAEEEEEEGEGQAVSVRVSEREQESEQGSQTQN